MIPLLIKRLCPLICFSFLIGCGKTINDTKAISARFQGPAQELSSDLTLQVNEVESPIKMFKLPRNAWFKLPTKLVAKNGNAVGKKIKIFYNLFSNRNYEFHCTYLSTNHENILDFEKCESSQGQVIISNSNDLESLQFPMDKDSSVKIQLTNPTGTGIKIDSTYVVDWK